MTEPDIDLLVIGDAVPDVVVAGLPGPPPFRQTEQLVQAGTLTVGGSSAIVACGGARLGLRVAFVGTVGDDAGGRFMLDELAARGVDTSGCTVVSGGVTGLTVHLVLGGAGRDRSMLTALGCVADLEPRMVPRSLVERARHLHVGSFFLLPKLAPGLPGLFAEARSAGRATSLDSQGDWSGRWRGGLHETLRATDVFLPNRDEAFAAAGTRDLDHALARLARLGPLPVVKLGADGAIALDAGQEVRVAAPRARPVDTIGAGDSFDAGFLYGRLHGWPTLDCLELAVTCGSLSTAAAGGVAAQPTLAEARVAMASHRRAPR